MDQNTFKDLFDKDRHEQLLMIRYPDYTYNPFWMWVWYTIDHLYETTYRKTTKG